MPQNAVSVFSIWTPNSRKLKGEQGAVCVLSCFHAGSPADSCSVGFSYVRAGLCPHSTSSSSSSSESEGNRGTFRHGRVSIHTDLELRWYVKDIDSEVCECVMRTTAVRVGRSERRMKENKQKMHKFSMPFWPGEEVNKKDREGNEEQAKERNSDSYVF